MFKLFAVSVVVAILSVAIDAKGGFGPNGVVGGKPEGGTGNQGNKPKPQGPPNCSTNAPSLSEKINGNQCELDAKVNEVLAKFQSQINADKARQMLGEVKALKRQTFQTATNVVLNAHPELVAEFTTADPSGYTAYVNSMVVELGVERSCQEAAAAFQTVYTALNEAGRKVFEKIECFVRQEAQKSGRSAMAQWFLANADALAQLKVQEKEFGRLLQVFQERIAFAKQ